MSLAGDASDKETASRIQSRTNSKVSLVREKFEEHQDHQRSTSRGSEKEKKMAESYAWKEQIHTLMKSGDSDSEISEPEHFLTKGAFLLTPSHGLSIEKASTICEKINFRGCFSLTKTATGILFKFSDIEDYQTVFKKGFHKVTGSRFYRKVAIPCRPQKTFTVYVFDIPDEIPEEDIRHSLYKFTSVVEVVRLQFAGSPHGTGTSTPKPILEKSPSRSLNSVDGELVSSMIPKESNSVVRITVASLEECNILLQNGMDFYGATFFPTELAMPHQAAKLAKTGSLNCAFPFKRSGALLTNHNVRNFPTTKFRPLCLANISALLQWKDMVGPADATLPPPIAEESPKLNGGLSSYSLDDSKSGSDTTLSMVTLSSSNETVNGVSPAKSPDNDLPKKSNFSDPHLNELQPLPHGKVFKQEHWWQTLFQVALPFFIAGCGTIGAGLVLGTVRDWEVFLNVSAIFVLVPSLSGLKGNLDMCLASRLSTQANLGNMEHPREVISMVVGNISLVQVQAIVAACIVAMFAVVVNSITDRAVDPVNILILTSSAIFTATTTCFALDFVMVVVILLSHKFKINPDNVATPLAASIGDIVTNTILSLTAQYMYDVTKTSYWQPITLLVVYFCLLPVWVYIVFRNKYTNSVLKTGWTPVISALFISGIGGLVLDNAVDYFVGYEVFQPIVNGIGGNLVSVHSSRISTQLHQTALPGVLPEETRLLEWPWKTLFVGTSAAKIARMLIGLGFLGQIVFMFVVDFIFNGEVTIMPAFGITYVLCATLQIMVLLYLAYVLVHFMWKKKKDPDNAVIPYLTAIGDLLGSIFLGLAFLILAYFGVGYGA